MTIEQFATKWRVPILKYDSKFPEYFATHALEPVFDFTTKELKSSDELGHANLTANIDRLLGTTNNVFFSLGKGYLKSQDSIGLIYDPFVITDSPGTMLVMNDLLYIVNDTQLLQDFFNQNKQATKLIMERGFSKKEIDTFWEAIENGSSLLIGDSANSPAHVFEKLLSILPFKLEQELKNILVTQIVEPNVKKTDLRDEVTRAFATYGDFLNTFSDRNTEERVIELQVPKSYPIDKGLLAVFVS